MARARARREGGVSRGNDARVGRNVSARNLDFHVFPQDFRRPVGRARARREGGVCRGSHAGIGRRRVGRKNAPFYFHLTKRLGAKS